MRQSIGLRLSLAYLFVALIFVMTVGLVVRTQNENIAETQKILEEDSRMFKMLWDLEVKFMQAWRTMRLAATQPSAAAAAAEAQQDVETLLDTIRAEEMPDEKEIGAGLSEIWSEIKTDFDRMKKNDDVFSSNILPDIDLFRETIRRFESARRRTSETRIEGIRENIARARSQFALFIVLLIVSGIGLVIFIRSNLLVPLGRLKEATEKIGSGEPPQTLTYKSDDELGDLTARFNQMSERLAEVEKAKMEFLSMVSHDMRTPLTAIGGYAGLLLEGRRGDVTQKQAEALKIISGESERLAFLVEDLLDSARAETGTFRIDPQVVNLAEVLPGAIKAFERQADGKKIQFQTDFSKLPVAVADAARLGQAIRNLVGNAFKFTPAGGTISVDGDVENEDIVIDVSDTGAGIAAENIPHLFDRFYQVSDKGEGVGLGLAIVKEIAAGHGGHVDVESTPGRGTTFKIYFPWKKSV